MDDIAINALRLAANRIETEGSVWFIPEEGEGLVWLIRDPLAWALPSTVTSPHNDVADRKWTARKLIRALIFSKVLRKAFALRAKSTREEAMALQLLGGWNEGGAQKVAASLRS